MVLPFNKSITRKHSFDDYRLTLILHGTVSAFDETLVHVIIPSEEQVPYIGRGLGECQQNLLAMWYFDIVFTFVWIG